MRAQSKQAKQIKSALLVSAILATCGTGDIGRAGMPTWDGSGTINNLSDNGNWAGGTAPAAGDVLVFDGWTRLAPVNDLPLGTLVGGIEFTATAGPFVVTGNQLDLAGSLTDNAVGIPETLNLALALQATENAAVVPGGSLAIGGIISGSGNGISETGGGVLTLSATNTFTGPVIVSGGTLAISADNNLGTAPASATPGSISLSGGAALQIGTMITLNANRGMSLLGPSGGTVSVTGGANFVTYDGIIADGGTTGGLTKAGLGTLVLGGQSTYTGATTIIDGELLLDFGQLGVANNILAPASALVLGGYPSSNPVLQVNSAGSIASVQSVNGTTLAGGLATVVEAAGANLNLGAITVKPGGNVVFLPQSGGSITTTTPATNGIFGGWATMGTVSLQGGTRSNFATVNGSNQIVTYSGYADYAARIGSDTGTIVPAGNLNGNVTASMNLKVSSTGTNSTPVLVDTNGANSTTDLNTLTITNSIASGVISIGTGNTLRFGNYGAILKQDTSNVTLFIGGNGTPQTGNGQAGSQGMGTLTAGGPGGGAGQIVFILNATLENGASLVVEPTIADNPAGGAVTVVQTGPGSMKLDGHNTYSGGTYILDGRVQVAGAEIGTGNPDGFGTGPVYVNPGGQAFFNGVGSPATVQNNFFVAGFGIFGENSGALRLNSVASSPLVIAGNITLTADAEVAGAGNPVLAGQITGSNALYIGANSTLDSAVVLGNSASNNNYTGSTVLNSRTNGNGLNRLILGANEQIPNGVGMGNLIVNGGSTAGTVFDLHGFAETVNGLASGANATFSFVENDSATAGTSTLTVGDGNQTATFGGVIRDNGASMGLGGSGVVALTKIGMGLQTLAGANTYSGTTTINAGALSVTGSLLANGTVQVNPGGALFGTGSVGNVLLAAANGTIRAAINPGTAGAETIGNLSLASLAVGTGANLQFDVASTSSFDVLNIAGGLTLANNTMLSVTGSWFPGVYALVNAGSISGPVPTLNYPANWPGTVSLSETATQILLNVSDVTQLVWTGAADGTTWGIAGQQNWRIGATPTAFFNGDNVLFDDTGIAHNLITFTGTVLPGNVTVNDSSGGYAFGTNIGGGGFPGNAIGGAGSLLKMGAGTLTLNLPNSYSGGTTVQGGVLNVGNQNALGSGGLVVHAGALARILLPNAPAAVKLPSLTIDGSAGNWTGNVDVAQSEIVVEAATSKSTVLATLRDQAMFGRTNLEGLTSSTNSAGMVVAVVDNGALTTPYTMFEGAPVDANSILIAATYPGDANLDLKVDVTDLSIILNNFGTTTAEWGLGNFDGAATIDLTDLSVVLNNFGNQVVVIHPGIAIAPGAVPESGSLLTLALGSAAMLRRKRSR